MADLYNKVSASKAKIIILALMISKLFILVRQLNNQYNVLNVLGIILGIWFLLTSWIWTYFGALYISYPIGLISLAILIFSPTNYGKSAIKIILIAGLFTSTLSLVLYK